MKILCDGVGVVRLSMYFVTKVLFSMVFWVVLARWGYAEMQRLSPPMASSVDRLIEVATIPTVDQWDLTKVRDFGKRVYETFHVEEAVASEE